MPIIDTHRKVRIQDLRARKLEFARLRQPTKLPVVVPTTSVGRYLLRLRWLFGGDY